MTSRESFHLGETQVRAGRRVDIELPVAKQVTGASIVLPVIVAHGKHEGPVIWLSAAIHGDEINGVEIIRRVLETIDLKVLSGTLLAVPIVNSPGFINGDRYLPDRRDLNRSFPGTSRGSMASQIAHIFMTEVVSKCSVGIDLHTGSDHRTNLPQIRANIDDPTTRQLAEAFATPVLMHSAIRDGSLRQAGTESGATVLLYEAGEAWRFDENSIRTGVNGILRVMAELGMIHEFDAPDSQAPISCRSSRWVRCRRSGIATLWVGLGDVVQKGQPIGRVHDAFGKKLSQISAVADGVVIGVTLAPIVNRGDAVVHIAEPEPPPDGLPGPQKAPPS